MRRTLTVFAIFALFVACILFAYAWFNLDFGPRPSTLDAGPRIWLEARTNIPGYTFVPEPVSDSVKRTLGTANILSGTFYKIGDKSFERRDSGNPPSEPLSTLDAGHSTLNDQLPTPNSQLPRERVSVFLASWPGSDNKGLTAIQHTPDICWGGSGWKPLNLGQPQQIIVELPIAQKQRSEVRGHKYAVISQG